jgi:dCTP diphosphatase
MSDIKKMTARIKKFRDARDWKQFHHPKDLAISLALEAAEVIEHFQWKNGPELEAYLKVSKKEIGDELADVLYWVLLLSDDLGIDVVKAFDRKMDENKKKYPVSKAKGRNAKYNRL